MVDNMLKLVMSMKGYYIALGIFMVIGIVGKFSEWRSMRKLLKASRNVKENDNHSLIKQMKLGYTNAYKLNYGVNNTKVFIEKYLAKNKVLGFPAAFVTSLEEKMILLCGISCLSAILYTVFYRKAMAEIVFVTGVGIISVLCLRLFGSFFSSYDMKQEFMIYMIDYFENVLQNRLHNHKKDSGRIIPVGGTGPKEPKLHENQPAKQKTSANTQTAAAQLSEELIVEEIIKEFFP